MSISKSFNKKTGITYVYDVYENYWDKNLKKQVTKRRLIGRIDEETGEIVPTRKRKVKPAPESAESHPLPAPQKTTPIPDSNIRTATMLQSLITSLQSEIDQLEHLKVQAEECLSSLNS